MLCRCRTISRPTCFGLLIAALYKGETIQSVPLISCHLTLLPTELQWHKSNLWRSEFESVCVCDFPQRAGRVCGPQIINKRSLCSSCAHSPLITGKSLPLVPWRHTPSSQMTALGVLPLLCFASSLKSQTPTGPQKLTVYSSHTGHKVANVHSLCRLHVVWWLILIQSYRLQLFDIGWCQFVTVCCYSAKWWMRPFCVWFIPVFCFFKELLCSWHQCCTLLCVK